MAMLSIAAVVISLTAPVAMAADLTGQLQAERMTVLKVDAAGGRFQCVEHRRWMPVARPDLAAVHPGDIVRVERVLGQPAHLIVLRSGTQELTSPEQ